MTMQFTLDMDGLDEFRTNIEGVDMDKVQEEGVKRAANELAARVRQNVSDNDYINSPSSLNSPYHPRTGNNASGGPAMARHAAWKVNPKGNATYRVEPHPKVRRRAIFLEYGTSGPITPNSADKLKFFVNGVPVYADSVSGIEAQGFWREAVRYMRSERRLKHHAEEALQEELRENNLT